MLRYRVERVANVGLLICAVALVGLTIRREFFPGAGSAAPGAPTANEPVFLRDWRQFGQLGTLIGSETAQVQIMEFADLQCPFCARFHNETLPGIWAEFGDQVAFTFLHFPLNSHPLARKAAIATECAKRERRFSEMVALIFQMQDSLGVRSWESYAAGAGVRDLDSFTRCLNESDVSRAVEANLELARSLGIRGTPGILVNGWYFPGGISADSLRQTIQRVVEGGPVLQQPG